MTEKDRQKIMRFLGTVEGVAYGLEPNIGGLIIGRIGEIFKIIEKEECEDNV